MNDVIRVVSNLIIISMILIIFVAVVGTYIENHYGYEYIDYDDNRAISRKCYMNDKGLFCKVKGGLVEVKQFGKR